MLVALHVARRRGEILEGRDRGGAVAIEGLHDAALSRHENFRVQVRERLEQLSDRAVAGALNPTFNAFPNNRLGDGVNVNDAPLRNEFPYLADGPSGRNRRHVDPGETNGGPIE